MSFARLQACPNVSRRTLADKIGVAEAHPRRDGSGGIDGAAQASVFCAPALPLFVPWRLARARNRAQRKCGDESSHDVRSFRLNSMKATWAIMSSVPSVPSVGLIDIDKPAGAASAARFAASRVSVDC